MFWCNLKMYLCVNRVGVAGHAVASTGAVVQNIILGDQEKG